MTIRTAIARLHCPRCGRQAASCCGKDYAERVAALEAERDRLLYSERLHNEALGTAVQEAELLRSELAEYRRGAERYRTALEQIVAPFEDLNFVSGNKLLTYIHDTATAALAGEGDGNG